MATAELGKFESVPVKQVWEHEALDFTPWLAENLDLLGEVLHLNLEEVQQEARVGWFSLDILAQETTSGALVAIENQLEWTDNDHLGKTLTYAGWHDVRILIWVAPHFTQQHRDVLEWLNRWTPYEIEAYGVEVRAIKIGCSKPAPVFEPVVLPTAWFARNTAEPDGISIAAKRKVFFQPLVDRLRKAKFTDLYTPYAREYQSFPVGIPDAGAYCASIEGTKAWVYIGGIDIWSAPRDITDGLRDCNRAEIERALGIERDSYTKMDWCTSPGTRNIGVWRDGSIDNSEEELEDIRKWMFHYLLMFKKVFSPRIDEIIAQQSSTEEAD